MKKVAVVYHSGAGNTAKVAHSIADGARSVEGVEVEIHALTGDQITNGRWEDEQIMAALAAADAIIFGAPTYMGMVSGVFKCFADATAGIWFNLSWQDKIAGGFTSSGYASGDKVMTLHYLVTLAAQLRMVWVGPAELPSNITGSPDDIDRNGYYIGVGAIGSMQRDDLPGAGDLKTAELYGARISEAALRWQPVTA